MIGPRRDDEVNTPATDEQVKDLPAEAADGNEVRGGGPIVSEVVVTKPTDVASPKLYIP